MRNSNTRAAMPIQPYIILLSENYKRIEISEMGISHFYEFQVKETDRNQFDAVPDGSIDLLFNISGSGMVHTYLSGTVFRVKRWEFGDSNTCFGVRFQPGMGVLPKGFSMDMIVNEDLEIDGRLYGGTLPEDIAKADGIVQRAQIFKEAYQRMAAASDGQDIRENVNCYVRDRISALQGNIAVETLAEETGYSACYIRRIFKQYNGISPKQFAQYTRFQHLLRILKEISGDYAQAAVRCGYYDEPHMIKEFKSYTGVTPEKYQSMIRGRNDLL